VNDLVLPPLFPTKPKRNFARQRGHCRCERLNPSPPHIFPPPPPPRAHPQPPPLPLQPSFSKLPPLSMILHVLLFFLRSSFRGSAPPILSHPVPEVSLRSLKFSSTLFMKICVPTSFVLLLPYLSRKNRLISQPLFPILAICFPLTDLRMTNSFGSVPYS